MKLTDIDLNDKTEVAAAHALLAAVLGEALPQQISAQRELPLAVTDQPIQDAAAVFGASPLAPAASAAVPASLPSSNGDTSDALSAAKAFITSEAAARGLPSLPAAGVELDSRGLPWDGRIHAGSKTKTAAGVWTALRGLSNKPEINVPAIEAELRTSVQGGAAPLAIAAPLASSAVLQGIEIASSSVPPAGVASPASADPVTFEQLMPRITQAAIAGIIPAQALQQVCVALGLPSVVALQANPAYVPHTWAQLKSTYPALQ